MQRRKKYGKICCHGIFGDGRKGIRIFMSVKGQMHPAGILAGMVLGGIAGFTCGIMTDKKAKIRKKAKKAMHTMNKLVDQVSSIAK